MKAKIVPKKEIVLLYRHKQAKNAQALLPLLESGVIDADGMDLKNGTLDRGDGTTAVYAIPADTLTGLSRYGNDPKNSLLCIPMYTKNADSAAALIGLMLEKLAAAGK